MQLSIFRYMHMPYYIRMLTSETVRGMPYGEAELLKSSRPEEVRNNLTSISPFDDSFGGLPALSKAAIDGVPRVPVAEEGKECCICLEDMNKEGGDEATEMPCKHRFHSPCVETWLLKCSSCPLCRMPIMPLQQEVIHQTTDMEQYFNGYGLDGCGDIFDFLTHALTWTPLESGEHS